MNIFFFDPALPHLHLATFPGMADRTVTLSSLGKTFSLTGWKIGWAIASPQLSAAVRAAHQFLTFATSTPMQHAAAVAMREGNAYIAELVADYHVKRDFLAKVLASSSPARLSACRYLFHHGGPFAASNT